MRLVPKSVKLIAVALHRPPQQFVCLNRICGFANANHHELLVCECIFFTLSLHSMDDTVCVCVQAECSA